MQDFDPFGTSCDGNGGDRWNHPEPKGCGLGVAGAGGRGDDSTPPGSEGDGLPRIYMSKEGTPCQSPLRNWCPF